MSHCAWKYLYVHVQCRLVWDQLVSFALQRSVCGWTIRTNDNTRVRQVFQAYGSFLTSYSPDNAPYDIDLGPVFLVNRIGCGRCGSADAFRLTGTMIAISLLLSPRKPTTHLQPRNHTQTTTSSTAKAISTAPKFQ